MNKTIAEIDQIIVNYTIEVKSHNPELSHDEAFKIASDEVIDRLTREKAA